MRVIHRIKTSQTGTGQSLSASEFEVSRGDENLFFLGESVVCEKASPPVEI